MSAFTPAPTRFRRPLLTQRVIDGRDHRDLARRQIITLIFLIYWLLIFEGALRKWILPQAQQYLFFIRDPFVLLVYFYAFKNRLFPRFSPLLVWAGLLAIAGLAAGLGAVLAGSVSPAIVVYGWRNYFLYLPLAFVIGEYFSAEDLNRLVRHTLLLAIPISIVVFLQFLAPAPATINAGLIAGGVYQPGVSGGIVRTYGTFTSSAGQTPFVASLVVVVLTAWILPRSRRPLRGAALILASGAAITCLALSGSRGAFILAGIVLAAALASSLLMTRASIKFRALFIPLIILAASAIAVTTIFSDAWQALVTRSVGAYDTESAIYSFGTAGRAFAGFTDFVPLLTTTPLLGYGLGTFGNAFGLEFTSLLAPSLSAESDWARNVLELGPVLGLLYIGLRIAIVISVARGAVLATRRSNNPMPFLLLGFCGVLLLQGQITGQGSVLGFGWLYAGFCMAANRIHATSEKLNVIRERSW